MRFKLDPGYRVLVLKVSRNLGSSSVEGKQMSGVKSRTQRFKETKKKEFRTLEQNWQEVRQRKEERETSD